VLFEHDYVKSWEGGENRKLDVRKIKEELEKVEEIKFKNLSYKYQRDNKMLNIILEWNK